MDLGILKPFVLFEWMSSKRWKVGNPSFWILPYVLSRVPKVEGAENQILSVFVEIPEYLRVLMDFCG